MLSKEICNELIETLYIDSIPTLKEEILEAGEEDFENCVPVDEIEL